MHIAANRNGYIENFMHQSNSPWTSDVFQFATWEHREPKRHHLAWKYIIWRIDRQNWSTSAPVKAEEWSKNEKGHVRNRNVTSRMFAETTYVVAVPHRFTCVVIPMILLYISTATTTTTVLRVYISSFIEIHSGVLVPHWPFPLLWLLACTPVCITVINIWYVYVFL